MGAKGRGESNNQPNTVYLWKLSKTLFLFVKILIKNWIKNKKKLMKEEDIINGMST